MDDVLRSCGLAVMRSCGHAVLRSCGLAVLRSCGLAINNFVKDNQTFRHTDIKSSFTFQFFPSFFQRLNLQLRITFFLSFKLKNMDRGIFNKSFIIKLFHH